MDLTIYDEIITSTASMSQFHDLPESTVIAVDMEWQPYSKKEFPNPVSTRILIVLRVLLISIPSFRFSN